MDFLKTKKYNDRYSLLNAGIELSPTNENDLWLEFGVYTGTTINFISELNPKNTIFGFDSFYGLPENWRPGMDKGSFNTNGDFPNVNENVVIIPGWFEDSIPKFLEENSNKNISFLHIDCDLYSSTIDILFGCHERIVSGTVICFDEFFNYPVWEDHEYKAWNEYCNTYDIRYDYVGHVPTGEQVLLVIK